jgi:hypothetical protein
MKWFLLLVVGWMATAVSTAQSKAQAYQPATEFHDRVQRHFVVEYARVSAWRENQAAAKDNLAEITYEVAISPERVTTWKVNWLDASGRVVREQTVSYPEEALLTGPAWYRSVASQLEFRSGAPGQTPASEIIKSYWAGAEKSLPSRAESLRQVFASAPGQDPGGAAGLLIHTTLPSIATETSLDAVLLARAAAWLCVAERTAAQTTPQLDALWAPLLFMAGREYSAGELWKKGALPGSTPLSRWWAFLLPQPLSKDAFAFAADPQYRSWAMPMLVYECRRFDLGSDLFEVIRQLSASPAYLLGLHDYGSYLSRECGVGVARIGEGWWPLVSRVSWGETLLRFKPEPLDFHAYTDAP